MTANALPIYTPLDTHIYPIWGGIYGGIDCRPISRISYIPPYIDIGTINPPIYTPATPLVGPDLPICCLSFAYLISGRKAFSVCGPVLLAFRLAVSRFSSYFRLTSHWPPAISYSLPLSRQPFPIDLLLFASLLFIFSSYSGERSAMAPAGRGQPRPAPRPYKGLIRPLSRGFLSPLENEKPRFPGAWAACDRPSNSVTDADANAV